VDVTSDRLGEFVAGLDATWVGLSLTMPLKQTVLPLLDHIEPLAAAVGAVNTVLVQGGRRPVLVGANTDVYGIVTALAERLPADATSGRSPMRTAAVLGGGATAASALAALAQLGCSAPVVYVRSLGRIGALRRAVHRMGVQPRYAPLAAAPAEIPAADLVVSTLPARAADGVADALGAPARGVLLDVVYDPRPTALALAWERAGGAVVGGERMLLHQAVEQVRLMTGRVAPVEAMERALAERLGA